MANQSAPAAEPGVPPLTPQAVAAARGAAWWGEAWRLFVPAVGVWVLIVLILVVLNVVRAVIPVVGHLASHVLFPVFAGGLMLGCRAIDLGEPLTVNQVFAGFSKHAGSLLIVGCSTPRSPWRRLAVAACWSWLSGWQYCRNCSSCRTHSPRAQRSAMRLSFWSGSAAHAVIAAATMAVWFAPAWSCCEVSSREQRWLSFSGCLANVVPF
jgi:hypothetical protein